MRDSDVPVKISGNAQYNTILEQLLVRATISSLIDVLHIVNLTTPPWTDRDNRALRQIKARAGIDACQQLLAQFLCRRIRRQLEQAARSERGS